MRIGIKKYSTFVEIGAKRTLPQLDLSEYSGNPAKVAQALRGMWKLPDGPVKNLTSLIESAGVVVVACDFGTRSMDATSLRFTEMPPMIFINYAIPGDRWRFTLAHELAHLVMHDVPSETMEDEADTFAAEFLMPEIEMRGQFSRYSRLRLQDFANFKQYWKTSMGALVERAHGLGYLDDNQRRYLWMTMAKLGYKSKEPNPVEKEEPKMLKRMVQYFMDELNYKPADFQKLLKLNPQELESLHGISSSGAFVEQNERRLKFRVVQ
jgi:Zn-dependent peptidase ImmA (M78 family)